MKYYQVTAKCGHVNGKRFYIEKDFYVRAENAKEAAEIARMIPRVKHHHSDAIRKVESITYEEYIEGRNRNNEDPYFFCHSTQEQNLYWDQIADDVMEEEELSDKKYRKKVNYRYRAAKERERYDRRWYELAEVA